MTVIAKGFQLLSVDGLGKKKTNRGLKRFFDVFSHPVDILRARYKIEFMWKL